MSNSKINNYFTKVNCVWNEKNCPVKKEKIEIENNFYTDYLMRELNISKKDLIFLKPKKCNNCGCLINKRWFNKTTSEKIFNDIYGQHHKGWKLYYDFFKKKKLIHKDLFNYLQNKIEINSYAEYNCPFTGLFLNFAYLESNFQIDLIKKNLNIELNFLRKKQLAHLNNEKVKKINQLNKNRLNLPNKNKKNITKKYLFLDDSKQFWSYNCISKNLNCKIVGSKLFNYEIIRELKKFQKINLFGLFYTLDHAEQPKKLLNSILNISQYVIIHTHIEDKINIQHKFTLTKQFKKYLTLNKVFHKDLTFLCENKKNQMYLLCSKKKISL